MSGVTATGFDPETYADALDWWKAQLRAAPAFGASVILDPDTWEGQFIAIASEREALLWELMQAVYAAHDPDEAEGAALDNIGAIRGVPRLPATYSTVNLTFYGDADTEIPLGAIVSSASTGRRFVTAEAETIAAGSVTVAAQCDTPGPITAIAGSLTTLVTTIFGVDSVTNATDAEPGRDEETDADYRRRSDDSLQQAGAGVVEAIKARLLDEINGVLDALVIENDTDDEDDDGRPPHSIECILRGGDEQDIIDKIFELKGAGIQTCSTAEGVYAKIGTAVDGEGRSHTINYSVGAPVPIWAHVALEVNANFDTGAAQVTKITVTEVADETDYEADINAVSFLYTSGVGATEGAILAGLRAAILAGTGTSYVPVTTTIDGTDLVLTANYAGCAFTVAAGDNLDIETTTEATGDQTAIIAAITARATEIQELGVKCSRSKYVGAVNDLLDGIEDSEITVSKTTADPASITAASVAILSAEWADFDSTRITVAVTVV